MNSLSKNLLTVLIAVLVGTSANANNGKKEAIMTTIKEELVALKENVQKFSADKTKEYSNQIKRSFDNQQKYIENLSDSAKEKMQHRYDQLQKEFKDIENAADSKKEQMYNDLVDKLHEFNKDLENSNK